MLSKHPRLEPYLNVFTSLHFTKEPCLSNYCHHLESLQRFHCTVTGDTYWTTRYSSVQHQSTSTASSHTSENHHPTRPLLSDGAVRAVRGRSPAPGRPDWACPTWSRRAGSTARRVHQRSPYRPPAARYPRRPGLREHGLVSTDAGNDQLPVTLLYLC